MSVEAPSAPVEHEDQVRGGEGEFATEVVVAPAAVPEQVARDAGRTALTAVQESMMRHW